jgi:hypothetical protein
MLLVLKDPDKGVPARAAQRLESTLMIHGACQRLMSERPDIPVVTIHDSILTLPEHIETVRGVIMSEFAKFGISPTLRSK